MDDFTDRSQFRIGDLLVIPGRLIVVRDGQEIKLEPRWMEVLVMLAEHAGETLSTERLLIEVWGSTVYGDSPVSKTISYIRKSISDDSRKPRYVETVSKVGYRLIAPVSLPEDYRRMPSERWTEGSPYVGLSAFGVDHASVFCGRSRIVADLLRAMRVQIENQRRFVLMVGASGCGKTSLLRAGAIPLLTKPDGFDGLRAVSVTTCDLAANGSDPLIPLATALAQWTLGGRPVFPPQTPEQLKALLTETPDMIEGFVSEALRRHSQRDLADQPYAHLLLTVDHAEALVATTDIDADTRGAFARVLQALCACPHVLVTMIARGDFYLKLIEALPALADLKAGDGHLDVIAPRYGEIGEIIRSPAWKADLSFETDPETRTRLDDALRDAALSQPDALPLLQHTLQTLYERRNDQRQLTFAAYNDIGGLEGAVAHRAEEVFAALPSNARASLAIVLAELIVIQPDNDTVNARRTSADTFDTDARTLVDVFTTARLFVRDRQNGKPSVGVVHEALLRRWPRAVEWTQDNRRLLQAKARLQRAAARWVAEGRQGDHLLNPGIPLAEALEAAERFAEDIGDEERKFIRESEKAGQHKRRLKGAAISLLTALTIASFVLAGITMQSRNEAEEQRDSLVRQAFAFRSVGEMVFNSANIKGAENTFLIVNENLRVSHEKDPESEEILAEYGVWSYWLGYFYDQNGQFKRAAPHWKRYLDISRKLTESSPHDLAWKMELSYALNNIGNLKKKGSSRISVGAI
jgi:eukaryotic-like serine/threonine-protein kinase